MRRRQQTTGLSSGEEGLGLVWIAIAADNQVTQHAAGWVVRD